jgi:NAD(P)H-dependent flavin oxidoreductase YrpB (nitropropane dioxygenase family)
VTHPSDGGRTRSGRIYGVGRPAPVVDRVHAAGALHLHVVGSVAEAKGAVDAGVDVVVAQGWEAGGRVRGQVAIMTPVPAVVDAVHPFLVIAAGEVGDGRGLAAVLAFGAQAGWLGTRFLTAEEALTYDVHCRRVVEAVAEDAVYTRCFDDGWPDAPHQVIRNSTLDGWDQPLLVRDGSRGGDRAITTRQSSNGRPRLWHASRRNSGLVDDGGEEAFRGPPVASRS